eukprot:g28594.t1
MKPGGKISFAPVFVEASTLQIFMWLYTLNFAWWISRTLRLNTAWFLITMLLLVSGGCALIHALRLSYVSKRSLITGMEEFDVHQVECLNESDRTSIHAAIVKWRWPSGYAPGSSQRMPRGFSEWKEQQLSIECSCAAGSAIETAVARNELQEFVVDNSYLGSLSRGLWYRTSPGGEKLKELRPIGWGRSVWGELDESGKEWRMKELEDQLEKLVGWGDKEDQGTARHFFSELRLLGEVRRGALPVPRALWVAAHAGSGRDTFVRLVCSFLHVVGAISREEVIWVDGQEIAHGDPTDLIAARLAAAEHGCLAIKDWPKGWYLSRSA